MFTLLPLLSGEGLARHGEILRAATEWIDAGKLTPRVDPRRFTLETVSDAYRTFAAGDARGRLVIEIAAAA